MSNETPEAVEAEVVEVVAPVEASKVAAQGSPIFSAPRSPIVTAASYLEHSVKAATGDYESRQYVMAADDATTNNTGWTLPQNNPFNEFISSSFGGRPAVDAVSRQALTASGMSFTIPRLTTAPTVGTVAEAAAPSETGMVSDYITVDVKKASGKNVLSLELLLRSSPDFYNELLVQMGRSYAKATDNAVLTALAAGTAATATAATAAGLQSFIATESAAAFKATSEYARNLVASPDQWAAIMGYADTTGRPLYTAQAVQNAPGAASGSSITGSVLGTNLYVDPNITTSGIVDDSAFLVVPEAVTFYEGPQTQLQVNLLDSGEVAINLFGFYAIATKKATGIRRYNLT
jgi:HK97 family phage major capsid protein